MSAIPPPPIRSNASLPWGKISVGGIVMLFVAYKMGYLDNFMRSTVTAESPDVAMITLDELLVNMKSLSEGMKDTSNLTGKEFSNMFDNVIKQCSAYNELSTDPNNKLTSEHVSYAKELKCDNVTKMKQISDEIRIFEQYNDTIEPLMQTFFMYHKPTDLAKADYIMKHYDDIHEKMQSICDILKDDFEIDKVLSSDAMFIYAGLKTSSRIGAIENVKVLEDTCKKYGLPYEQELEGTFRKLQGNYNVLVDKFPGIRDGTDTAYMNQHLMELQQESDILCEKLDELEKIFPPTHRRDQVEKNFRKRHPDYLKHFDKDRFCNSLSVPPSQEIFRQATFNKQPEKGAIGKRDGCYYTIDSTIFSVDPAIPTAGDTVPYKHIDGTEVEVNGARSGASYIATAIKHASVTHPHAFILKC